MVVVSMILSDNRSRTFGQDLGLSLVYAGAADDHVNRDAGLKHFPGY